MTNEIDCWFEREDGTRYWDDSPAWWFWSAKDQRWHWEGYDGGTHDGLAIVDEVGVTVFGTSQEIEQKRDDLLTAARRCGVVEALP